MKTQKSISESLDQLYAVAQEFTDLLRLNKVVGHFTVSSKEKSSPVISETEVVFYQPEHSAYDLDKGYTHISIGKIVCGKYGVLEYKRSHTPESVDAVAKEAKKILDEFKTFSFGTLVERSLLDKRNEVRRCSLALRKAKKEAEELQKELASYGIGKTA